MNRISRRLTHTKAKRRKALIALLENPHNLGAKKGLRIYNERILQLKHERNQWRESNNLEPLC